MFGRRMTKPLPVQKLGKAPEIIVGKDNGTAS